MDTTTSSGSCGHLNIALSSAPPCMVRMHSGNDKWVREDGRCVLEDLATCNILVLQGDKSKLNSALLCIHKISDKIKSEPCTPMSYRLPALVSRSEEYHLGGQQQRASPKGVGLFVRLAKEQSWIRRRSLNIKIDKLHQDNQERWKLYLRTCWRRNTDEEVLSVRERIRREFRRDCLSCGCVTFWDKTCGIRRRLSDGKCHHFCKKITDFTSESFKAVPWLEREFRTRLTI